MTDIEEALSRADERLRRAQWLLSSGASHMIDGYDWLLVVTCLVGADELLASVPADRGRAQGELLAEVIEELSDVTNNFQLPAFLSASKAGRRGAPHLFQPRRAVRE